MTMNGSESVTMTLPPPPLNTRASGPGGDIYRLLGEVVAELPAIGKNRENTEQQFRFRGYDDVMDALNPILGAKGLFPIPDILERERNVRQTRSGGTMYEVNLHVRFTIYAPDGSWVSGSAWGEGTDMGDKATSKAMTMAFKYFLFEAFAISTNEVSDPDGQSAAMSDPESFHCGVCANEGAEFVTANQQEMRDHLADAHGWERQPDGRVSRPRAPVTSTPRTQDGSPVTTTPTTRPAAPAATTGAPAPTGEAGGGTTVDTGADADDSASTLTADDIMKMSKQQLAPLLSERNLKTSGSLGDMRARLIMDVENPQTQLDPTATQSPQSDDAATASGDTHGATGDAGDEPFACPDCDGGPFKTQEEYESHWFDTHGADEPDGSAEDTESNPIESAPADGVGDDIPADAETIKEIKSMVAQLQGPNARAYAKYRRESGIGKPDELMMAQALDLIEFLEGLMASTS